MKKHLTLTVLFLTTVSALPAQAGLLSLGSGLAASAGSSGFGTSNQVNADTSINTTGIIKTTGLKAQDDTTLSGRIDTGAGSSVTNRHHRNLLKSTVATELDEHAKAESPEQPGLPRSSPVTAELASHAEANAYGTYNR